MELITQTGLERTSACCWSAPFPSMPDQLPSHRDVPDSGRVGRPTTLARLDRAATWAAHSVATRRADRVDQDVIGAEFGGEHAGEGVEGDLRRGVVTGRRWPATIVLARHVDDPGHARFGAAARQNCWTYAATGRTGWSRPPRGPRPGGVDRSLPGVGVDAALLTTEGQLAVARTTPPAAAGDRAGSVTSRATRPRLLRTGRRPRPPMPTGGQHHGHDHVRPGLAITRSSAADPAIAPGNQR